AELTRRDDLDRIPLQQIGDLLELAAIMCRDHQPRLGQPPGHPATAAFCAATSEPMPASARSISTPSCSREKVAPSALPCTSISPRPPVITKFASVPATLSSA